MRGKYALHIQQPEPENLLLKARGRNPSHRERRDKKLAARYYYYTKIHRLLYEVTIDTLSLEFDLSADRIIDLLTLHPHYISNLTKSQTSLGELRREYPFFVWKEPLQLSLF